MVEEFDKLRKTAVAGGNRDQVKTFLSNLDTLSQKAKDARTDLAAAKEQIESSDENYNDPIFAAMVRFVTEVDSEIQNEIGLVRKKLSDE